MKLGEFLTYQPALGRFNQMPLKAKTSLKVKRIVKRVTSELEDFEKVRKELLEKYGTLGKSKEKYEFPDPEKEKQFNEEYEQLMDSEVELKFEKITFGEIAEETISPADLIALSWMISGMDDEDEEKTAESPPAEPSQE